MLFSSFYSLAIPSSMDNGIPDNIFNTVYENSEQEETNYVFLTRAADTLIIVTDAGS